jgi:hypothetical protein
VTGTCELCGLGKIPLTEHHLIPRMRHNKRVKRDYGEERNRKADVCKPCHRQLHELFTEKELEREYNTLEKLKASPEVRNWIEWRRKHQSFT